MKIDSVALMFLVLMALVGLLFCKAVEFVVDWATRGFGKKIDPIDLLRMELNGLNIKIDAFGNKLDYLKTEVNAVKAKLGSLEKLTEQHGFVPASRSSGMSEDTWQRSELVQDEPISTAPTMRSTSADSWTRDTGV